MMADVQHNLSPFDEFLSQLRLGDWDHRLDELTEVARQRYEVRRVNAATLYTVGSRVRAPYDAKPRHMANRAGTVTELRRNGKLAVQFDHRPHETWTWPADQLVPETE